jgi:hypothetical protein
MTEPKDDSRWAAPDQGTAAGVAPAPPVPMRITLPPSARPVPTPPPPWPAPGRPPAGGGTGMRVPSGLFPSGPPRPVYREHRPARTGAVAAGAGAGALWMLLFGLVASGARAYAWWTIAAALVAWLVALLLARFGDRGVAAGVALTSGLGLAIAGVVVFAHLLGGHWLLW